MTIDIDRLIALCEKATPGPWTHDTTDNHGTMIRAADGQSLAECWMRGTQWPHRDNAAFIAACDPQTILALCAENKRLTAEVERLRGEGNAEPDIRLWDSQWASIVNKPGQSIEGAVRATEEKMRENIVKGWPKARFVATDSALREWLSILAENADDGMDANEGWGDLMDRVRDRDGKLYGKIKAALKEHFAPSAHSTSAAAEGTVTDAMVEAACVAFEKHPTTLASDYETPAMRAALEAALAAAPGGNAVTIRNNDDGSLDEICTDNFHLEQMSDSHWWMEIGGVHVNLTARGKITATVCDERGAPGGEK